MKQAFVYGLLAALAITGCQAELEVLNPENNTEPEVITQEPSKVFTAIVDEDFNSETKTSLDGSGNVLWKKGDQVSIFAASTVNEQYQVSNDSDGKTAATLNKIPAGDFVAGTDIDNNVAFYPYASTAEIAKSGSNYVISGVEFPATQTYAAGSFGNGAFPMATVTSSTEDMNLKFKNVLGGLKLQLKGTATITSITVTGNNNEILCGDAEVTTTYGGVPSIVLSDASAKTVTLNCGAGVTLDSETATPFIIALPPMTMTGGFTVVVTDTEGKQMEIKTTKPQTITRSNLLKMPAVNYVGAYDYFTVTSIGNTTVRFNNSSDFDINLEYRIDSGSWASYTMGYDIELFDGESVQFRAGDSGNESFCSDWMHNKLCNFIAGGSGTIALSGNIMSLLDKDMIKDAVPADCFNSLFRYETKIIDASGLKLPATSLAERCYAGMFMNCYGLVNGPEILPATVLAVACYNGMFSSCSQLIRTPVLPATKLAKNCYYGMFSDCSKLTTAPAVLPALSLADGCYHYMFSGCTKLEAAPALPATDLAPYCYASMFMVCTTITSAPTLPATKLQAYCYERMFVDCTNITSAPALPAPTLVSHFYEMMFNGCSSLNYIKALFTTTPSSTYTENWVRDVAATGTFVKSSSAKWKVTGNRGVPSGWSIITE